MLTSTSHCQTSSCCNLRDVMLPSEIKIFIHVLC